MKLMTTNNYISDLEIINAVKAAKNKVNANIYCNQTMLVNTINEITHYSKLSIENSSDINFEDALDYKDEIINFLKDATTVLDESEELTEEVYLENKETIDEFLKNDIGICNEWYEAWLCSDWFLDMIKEQGGLIGDFDEGTERWWLRQTTGQHYELDTIFQNIVLEIAARSVGLDIEALKEEISLRKLNGGRNYLSGFVCNIEYINANN